MQASQNNANWHKDFNLMLKVITSDFWALEANQFYVTVLG